VTEREAQERADGRVLRIEVDVAREVDQSSVPKSAARDA